MPEPSKFFLVECNVWEVVPSPSHRSCRTGNTVLQSESYIECLRRISFSIGGTSAVNLCCNLAKAVALKFSIIYRPPFKIIAIGRHNRSKVEVARGERTLLDTLGEFRAKWGGVRNYSPKISIRVTSYRSGSSNGVLAPFGARTQANSPKRFNSTIASYQQRSLLSLRIEIRLDCEC